MGRVRNGSAGSISRSRGGQADKQVARGRAAKGSPSSNAGATGGQKVAPRAQAIVDSGVVDFGALMWAQLGDVIAGRLDPRTAHAACNTAGKLLQYVRMQMEYERMSVRPKKPNGKALSAASFVGGSAARFTVVQ